MKPTLLYLSLSLLLTTTLANPILRSLGNLSPGLAPRSPHPIQLSDLLAARAPVPKNAKSKSKSPKPTNSATDLHHHTKEHAQEISATHAKNNPSKQTSIINPQPQSPTSTSISDPSIEPISPPTKPSKTHHQPNGPTSTSISDPSIEPLPVPIKPSKTHHPISTTAKGTPLPDPIRGSSVDNPASTTVSAPADTPSVASGADISLQPTAA